MTTKLIDFASYHRVVQSRDEIAKALRDALKLIDAMMPGVRFIALQDYKALNDVPLAAERALAKVGL